MKKLIRTIVLFGLFFPLCLTAQETSVAQNPNTEYPVLEKKLKNSDEDMADPKKNITPKFWISRAKLMMDIYNVNRKYIENQQKLTITFSMGKEKEIRTEEKNGELLETYVYDRVNVIFKDGIYYNYIETSKIYNNPLDEASKALDKAVETDVEGKNAKKIKESFIALSELYTHQGTRAYFIDKDQQSAYNNFVASLNINEKPVMENKIDTSLIFNVGLIASQLELYNESIKYFEKALEYNYPEPRIYAFLKQDYLAIGDSAKGLEILQKGFTKYPESLEIVVELINYYLVTDKSEEALNYIRIAQEKDPSNTSLVFAEGTLYDKKGEYDKAIAIYKKTYEMDPNYFNGYYNLGVLYYNRGQQLSKDADKMYKPGNTEAINESKKLQVQGDEQFKLAVEPMESCMKILEAKPNVTKEDKETLKVVYETLKSLYYRMQQSDASYGAKIEEVKAKLEQL